MNIYDAMKAKCCHRSHVLGLKCRRPFHWDGYCVKHVNTCMFPDEHRYAGPGWRLALIWKHRR